MFPFSRFRVEDLGLRVEALGFEALGRKTSWRFMEGSAYTQLAYTARLIAPYGLPHLK